VVADDYVAFSTESCELEIITRAGKPLWTKWLGDLLMSMQTIAFRPRIPRCKGAFLVGVPPVELEGCGHGVA
jgi:hypothetical protein